jgi:outer membrane protein assembly factor BamB
MGSWLHQHRRSKITIVTIGALCCGPWMLNFAAAQSPQQPPRSWRGLAGGGARVSSTVYPLPDLSTPAWVHNTDADGNAITFIGQAPTAVSPSSVFAVGRVSPPGQPANQTRLFAFDRDDGDVAWWMPVASTVLDSNSGPALDERAGTVIFASQRFVTAFDKATGAQRWQAMLTRSVVNASPLVVNEPGLPGRVFITDYDGFGTAAKLYCINTGPLTPDNPHQPGDIIWSAPIGGASGNTPAYLPFAFGGTGLVYTTTPGDGAGAGNPGKIIALDAFADVPMLIFTFVNPLAEGFFGGLCVQPPAVNGEPPSLYAATYAFSGGVDAGNLVKVNGATGTLVWSIACNRTQSIPIPLPGGRVVLSAGIEGFGSVRSLSLFQDLGTSATMVWDTALLTEPSPFGGWTQQPVASTFAGRSLLALGLIPAGGTFSSPSNELCLIDLDRSPTDPAFVLSRVSGSGGSPSAPGSSLISIGAAGLSHFGPTPAALDLSQDGFHAIDDAYAWESGLTTISRDLDRSGSVTPEDRTLLIANLRAAEPTSMMRGRP